MESNKDFALWAKRKADKAISLHDFTGAKECLSLARFLVPNLDGMEQMAAIVDVNLAGQLRVSGNEMDMYAVLQVDPCADVNTINKQYRKLALTLHPDRNKVVGADAAFRVIVEAFGTLSDRAKRALHDMKRISFWAACPSCKTALHIPRKYESSELHCPSCRLGFVARDTCAQNGIFNGHKPFSSRFANSYRDVFHRLVLSKPLKISHIKRKGHYMNENKKKPGSLQR